MKALKKAAIFAVVLALLTVLLSGCGNNPADDTGKTNDGGVVADGADNADSDDSSVPETYEELSEGDSAPDFTAETVGGGEFKLSEQSDKVVILNFWATWCPPCVGEMPAFQKLYDEYGDTLAVLAVNCLEDKETVDKFASDNGYTFPIAYDEDGDINMKYPTDGIPYTVIIGTDGKAAKIYVGAGDAEAQYNEYKSAIDAVMEENS